jgi:putative ABC transport system substrate-binding protein
MLKSVQAAARGANVNVFPMGAQTPAEIERAFANIVGAHAGAVMVVSDLFFWFQSRQIVELALKNRMPSIFAFREPVQSGGLMSYGVSDAGDSYRRAATYVNKILKGTKPGDLPVEQPTKFELVINLKTAKALDIKIPQSLLLRANEVIE